MVYTKKGFRIIDSEGLGQFLDLLETFGGIGAIDGMGCGGKGGECVLGWPGFLP
jgi:hypothetical protein